MAISLGVNDFSRRFQVTGNVRPVNVTAQSAVLCSPDLPLQVQVIVE
ncbi:MAG: hypothetical protein R3E64_12630 [Halioglobus sp.]